MKILILFLVLIGLYLLYLGFDLYQRKQIGNSLIKESVPFEIKGEDYTKTILVLGDSTGVGVGASPEESVAGLLSKYVGATFVENHSVSGAEIKDIFSQIDEITLDRYDIVLIQIGANNIINLDSAESLAPMMKDALEKLKGKTDNLIHMSAGNVGAATAIPIPLRSLYQSRTLKYHEMFEDLAKGMGTTYVNLYEPRETDPFIKNPEKYLSKDGLHPTSDGYLLWFNKLKEFL